MYICVKPMENVYFEGINKGILEVRSKSVNIKVFEKFKPLMDDGFDGNDIIEYFTVKLIDYIDNKYEPTKTDEDGGK